MSLHGLRRFAAECGMNVIAMKKTRRDPPGFSQRWKSKTSGLLENAKHDGADKSEGDVGGHDA
jgi:hypothetical protein